MLRHLGYVVVEVWDIAVGDVVISHKGWDR